MKSYKILIAILAILAFYNVFGAPKSYPFEVQVSGKGKQSIIFIPGFASSGEVWNETKVKYEKKFTCYTLTMAGFAGVQPQPNSTFANWENKIAEYIKDNKIEKPIIIGHSMGGGLAMAIAADYPDLVSKLIVVDALPCLMAMNNPGFKPKENIDCSSSITKMKAMSDEDFSKMQKASMSRLLADTTMQETVVGWSVKSDRETFAKMFCDFSNTDLREKIKNIKCSSLILLESYFVNFKSAIEDQYKNLNNADLRYATKGLHFIMYDDKEWYFNQLENFIH